MCASGIGNVCLYMAVVSANQVLFPGSAWCFALFSMILVPECFVRKAGVRHLLHREAALICVGTVLPLATGMHLHREENKQKCVLGTHIMQ